MSHDDDQTERFDRISGPDDNPAVGDDLTPPRKARTGLIVGGVLAAVVVVGGIVAASLFGATNGDGNTAGTATPIATDSGSTSTPEPSTTPQPTTSTAPTEAATDQVALPTDCQSIYTPERWTELMSNPDLPLNDPMVVNQALTPYPDVQAILEAGPKLACSWGTASEFGIVTWVTEVTPAQRDEAVQALRANGNDCGEQLGGIRCTEEFRDEEGGTGAAGYSHVLRGNLWIATHWVNLTPENYSEDIVDVLFS